MRIRSATRAVTPSRIHRTLLVYQHDVPADHPRLDPTRSDRPKVIASFVGGLVEGVREVASLILFCLFVPSFHSSSSDR